MSLVKQALLLGSLTAFLVPTVGARAEDKEQEKESFSEIEIGAAVEWGLSGSSPGFGPAAAIEFAPLGENWPGIKFGAGKRRLRASAVTSDVEA